MLPDGRLFYRRCLRLHIKWQSETNVAVQKINKQTEAVYQTDTPPLLSFWNLFLTIYASQSQPLRDYKALH